MESQRRINKLREIISQSSSSEHFIIIRITRSRVHHFHALKEFDSLFLVSSSSRYFTYLNLISNEGRAATLLRPQDLPCFGAPSTERSLVLTPRGTQSWHYDFAPAMHHCYNYYASIVCPDSGCLQEETRAPREFFFVLMEEKEDGTIGVRISGAE